eukprot:TRINITY_DN9719_c0_g2_i2.p1 TRINITY_DN9719_c0_g2~~TRINITY_DN9719_c0_g2_i2.p1  ORF type:complete len:511 (+),score=127.87 TRINITY_DN9719_c0_g2_i2:13-1545(+)
MSIPGEVGESSEVCELCDLPATKRCAQDNHWFCEDCGENHARKKGHRVESIAESKNRFCAAHKEEYAFYCTADRVLVCRTCDRLDHFTHKVIRVEEAFEAEKKFIDTMDKSLRDSLNSVFSGVTAVKKEIGVLEKASEDAAEDIESSFAVLESLLHERKNLLLHDLKQGKDMRMQVLKLQQMELNNALQQLTSLEENWKLSISSKAIAGTLKLMTEIRSSEAQLSSLSFAAKAQGKVIFLKDSKMLEDCLKAFGKACFLIGDNAKFSLTDLEWNLSGEGQFFLHYPSESKEVDEAVGASLSFNVENSLGQHVENVQFSSCVAAQGKTLVKVKIKEVPFGQKLRLFVFVGNHAVDGCPLEVSPFEPQEVDFCRSGSVATCVSYDGRGYEISSSEDVTIRAVRCEVDMPSGVQGQVLIMDSTGNTLCSGSSFTGTGCRAWLESKLEYKLRASQKVFVLVTVPSKQVKYCYVGGDNNTRRAGIFQIESKHVILGQPPSINTYSIQMKLLYNKN